MSAFLAIALAFSASVIYAAADSYTHTVYINEICSSNGGEDNLTELVDQSGDYLDWVELYNPSDNDINIGGYGLSDGKKNKYKLKFADNTVIEAKGFLIVYCSKYVSDDNFIIAPIGISASGETIYLTDSAGNAVDMVNLPAIKKDTTYSRVPDGSDKLYNTTPTPGSSNSSAAIIYNAPIFSVASGIYSQGFELSLKNDNSSALDLYYTTNGSDPRTSDTAIKYTEKINITDRSGEPNVLSKIDPTVFSPVGKAGNVPSDSAVDKATVIRACAKDAEGNMSLPSAATYFVGGRFSDYGDITLVSISTDYDNLFDYENGIYTKGRYYDEYKAEHPDEADYWGTKGNYSLKGNENKMQNYYILYNPKAGNGKGEEAAKKLSELLNGELTYIDITSISDYSSVFAAMQAEDKLVICGGDGTLNRFVNDAGDILPGNDILYYATGSGNDFLHDLGKEPETSPVYINEYITNLPIVEVNGKQYKFINGIGFGIDGYCCEVGDNLRETTDKPINYTSIAIKGLLFHYKPTNAVITVDGEVKKYEKVWLAPTMNGRYYGGGMMPTPDQDRLNNDTVSTLVMFGSGKLKTLMVFPSIFKGEHIKHTEMAQVLSGKDITVEFDRPTAIQIDGETIVGVTKYSVKAAQKTAENQKSAARTESE